jgi:hypothetical protein
LCAYHLLEGFIFLDNRHDNKHFGDAVNSTIINGNLTFGGLHSSVEDAREEFRKIRHKGEHSGTEKIKQGTTTDGCNSLPWVRALI